MKKVYYLYSHIREDKNEPFYIGIGTVSPVTRYKRAKAKDGRNNIWNKIVAKTSYSIEILLEHSDYSFIKSKEIELIKFYGKIKDKTGILSNIADGGEGNHGYVPTLENRLNQSARLKGRKLSEETKRRIGIAQKGKIVPKEVGEKISIAKKGVKPKVKVNNKVKRVRHIPTNKVYPSLEMAAKEFNHRTCTLSKLITNKGISDLEYISNEEYTSIIELTGQVIPKRERKKHSEEHKKNIGNSIRGRKHTQDSKNKMSIAQKGKTRTEEAKRNCLLASPNRIRIRHIESGMIYESIKQAAKSCSISSPGLRKQLNSGNPVCLFEFLDRPNPPKVKIRVVKHRDTGQIFYSVPEAARNEGVKTSCLDARIRRKSKLCKYYFDYI